MSELAFDSSIEFVELWISEVMAMFSESGRIPLWVVATVAGLGVLSIVALFFYGAYAGLGSSM